MDKPTEELRILMLEDVPSDAELIAAELRDGGLAFTSLRVDTHEAFEQALDEFKPDVILADFRLPAYNGRDALLYTRSTHPWIPVIMVTGALGDEAAVELLKLGARDYVLKDRLARLAPAIKRAMSEEKGIRNRKLAEGKYKAVFAEAMDGIVLVDAETWQTVDCNAEFEKQTGRTLAQLKEIKIWEILLPEHHEPARQALLEVQNTGTGRGSAFKMQKPGGEIVPYEFSAKFLDIQQQHFIQAVTRDISERLRAEQALRDSEDKFRSIAASAQDAILMMDDEGRISYWNAAAEKIFGYTAQETIGKPLHELLAPARFQEDYRKGFSHFKDTGEGPVIGKTTELAGLRKDGSEFPLELSLSAVQREGLWNAIGIVRDITERKQAEAQLRQERDFSNGIVETAQTIILVLNPQGRIVRFNHFMETLTGYSLNEVEGQDWFSVFIPASQRDEVKEKFQGAIHDIQTRGFVNTILTKDGRQLLIEWYDKTLKDEQGNITGLLSVGLDVTERERAEDALRRANRALKTLSAGNLALVHAKSEDELLQLATSVIVEQGGYRLAVVDYADDDPESSITPMAWSGMEKSESQYWAQHLSWADTEQGQLPVSRAIRSGTTQICHDIASDPGFAPWKDAAQARGYVSNIALPLLGDGRTFGGLSIYSSDTRAFDEEEVRLLEELANDLAYGIITLRTRAEHEQHAKILRQSLEQSIQTIAGTVEARDPYTAGHQKRVGELATAIAREMGLPEEQVNGIHLAAMIHDLGKIHIPAEILSKPGKLSEIEYMLIKTHPQSGYDILKDVKFPWPIADIILQHHERLDGSGYPQGLKGDQILLDARILTVADVVEAMSSHRPYRPTLGSVAALSEINRGRGSVYDPAVVDACMRLVTEKGFRFSSKPGIS